MPTEEKYGEKELADIEKKLKDKEIAKVLPEYLAKFNNASSEKILE
jgi:hypothetical protein